jgi:hypothetical protein
MHDDLIIPESEPLYLVGECGEAFDSPRSADAHIQEGDCDDCLDSGGAFRILPESEAF